MKTTERAESQPAAAILMRELDTDELDAVSGGDKAREQAIRCRRIGKSYP